MPYLNACFRVVVKEQAVDASTTVQCTGGSAHNRRPSSIHTRQLATTNGSVMHGNHSAVDRLIHIRDTCVCVRPLSVCAYR